MTRVDRGDTWTWTPLEIDTKPIVSHFVCGRNSACNRRFTRLTNAFSNKFENHAYMVALYAVWYNFCRIHKALRVSPALAAALPIGCGAWKMWPGWWRLGCRSRRSAGRTISRAH